MKALLLAAGLGTRLRPLTNVLPKCLAPVRARPLLGYWLDMLFSAGIEEVLINTHYMPEMVKTYVSGTAWSDRITLSYEPQLLGTGGTMLNHESWLRDSPCLVIHADNLSCFSLDDFLASHLRRPSNCIMTMMTFLTTDPQSCGVVECNAAGVVVAFHEKVRNPPTTIANAAVYIFEPRIFDLLHSLQKRDIDLSTEIIPLLLGQISTYLNVTYHRDIGTIESWREAQRDFSCRYARLSSTEPWNRILAAHPGIMKTVESLLQ